MPATPIEEALSVLERSTASMADVMSALAVLDRNDLGSKSVRLGLVANITVDLLVTYLRRHAYLCGVRLEVISGTYDNLLGDIECFCAPGTHKLDYLIVIPFFDNLQASWEAQVGTLVESERHAPMVDYLGRLHLALRNAANVGTILLATGCLRQQPAVLNGKSVQEVALAEFNAALRETVNEFRNVHLLDTTAMVTIVGSRQAFDDRFYFRGKAPYTTVFMDEFARFVSLATRSFGTKFYKVLVLDCDNTLWGGIVGEEGPLGIKLDPHSYPGNIFWNVQQQIRELEQRGTLICLCSKNNPEDVDEILARHPHSLREDHIVAKKINWTNKVENLRQLARELNLGLDSFIFVDDSAFEVEAVRQQLPSIRVFQVPKSLSDYPRMMRDIAAHYLAGGVSNDSLTKTQQYRHLAEAAALQSKFSSQEDYLRSLCLKVRIFRDSEAQIERISELIYKSNQFNLTTQRLLAGEVQRFMNSDQATVYSFSVGDRLTDHGVTGVLIIEYSAESAHVHSFLMSCRVIGRGIEFSIWRSVIQDVVSRGKRWLSASYIPTSKNMQVADFYDRLGLTLVSSDDDGSLHYRVDANSAKLTESEWVEVYND